MERWIVIDEFPEYEVSSFGNVRTVKSGVIRRQYLGSGGYPRVSLRSTKSGRGGKRLLVHRLVAKAFIGIPDRMVVNHLDGNKENNNIENLEVCTQKENMIHSVSILGNTNGWSGRKHLESTKLLIGKTTAKAQKGCGNSQFGTFWYTDGTTNIKLRAYEEVPISFYRGRTI